MNTQFRTSLYYGFFSAISCFIFFLIIYFIGKNPVGNWSWLGFWIPILFMILGVKAHRDIDLGGTINYGHALGTSFIVAVSGALMFAILAYLFGILIGTNIPSMMISESAEQIEKAKQYMGETMYEKAMMSLEEMKGNTFYALFKIMLGDFEGKVIGGFIVSLLVAAFMKKSGNPFPERPL